MSEQGKCDDCGQPTTKRKDGTFWRRCFDCNSKAKAANDTKQETLPVKSAQEEAGDIFTVFKTFLTLLKEAEPKITPELAYATALGLTTQYWSNHRTPGGVR